MSPTAFLDVTVYFIIAVVIAASLLLLWDRVKPR
jgi:hypothetical protein